MTSLVNHISFYNFPVSYSKDLTYEQVLLFVNGLCEDNLKTSQESRNKVMQWVDNMYYV